jgi:hypothetical protein
VTGAGPRARRLPAGTASRPGTTSTTRRDCDEQPGSDRTTNENAAYAAMRSLTCASFLDHARVGLLRR